MEFPQEIPFQNQQNNHYLGYWKEYYHKKKEKKDKHQEGYFSLYYQNHRQKLLAYSHEYYQVQKLLEPYLTEKKKNTDRHRLNYYQEYEKNNPKRKEYKRVWIANKRAKEKDQFGVKCVVDKKLPTPA
jgi:hypothetical protein